MKCPHLGFVKGILSGAKVNGPKVALDIMQSNAKQSLEMNKHMTGQE